MTPKLKKTLYRIIFALVLFGAGFFLPFGKVIFAVGYLVVGYDVIWRAFRNGRNGQFFDENFLMTIATFGAFALGDFAEAMAVMLFYQVGEFFQSYAVNRSRKSIAELMDIRPDYANVEVGGKIKKVDPTTVKVGDIIVIKPSEKIPLDGVVMDGRSSINTSALTGESIPRDVVAGDNVISGCINMSGVLRVKVAREFAESTASKILDLVENATNKKAPVENFITRFAKYYTPTVVFLAMALAVLPPLLISGETFSTWLYRAIVFLVVSCPCALVISVPLSFFAGLGLASRKGILVKGSNYLEALAEAKYFVFDKTGTLTKGNFKVSSQNAELLGLAAYAEVYSHHPIAKSIGEEYGKKIDLKKVKNVREIQGLGVEANVDGKEVAAGNIGLMEKLGIRVKKVDGTVVYVAMDGEYLGYILISDEIKDDSKSTIEGLKSLGIKKTIMLTGDRDFVGKKVGKELGIDEAYTELLPADKVEKVEELMAETNGRLAFVGDGVNDAPVLARSDVGIAMGGIGSDAAIEAADVVIMGDEPSKIVTAIKIARQTLAIAKQNIVFAIGVKVLVLVLGAFGLTSIWMAVFADVGVTVLAVLNSLRGLIIND